MDGIKQRIISILVSNQPGVLSRIAGLFSRRGYNIDALTVCATEDERYSRMTITVTAQPATVRQIVAQLEKQEDVIKVVGLDGSEVAYRELLLIKLAVSPAERSQIVDLCTLFKAKAIDINADSIMLELTGSPEKVDNFVKNLSVYTILEMARTGGAALERGGGSMAADVSAGEE